MQGREWAYDCISRLAYEGTADLRWNYLNCINEEVSNSTDELRILFFLAWFIQ